MIRNEKIQVARSRSNIALARTQAKGRQSTLAWTNPALGSPATQGSNMMGGPSGVQSTYIGGVDMMTPYIEQLPHPLMCKIYDDIYRHDAISGAAVELMCNLPFGDFKLIGVNDSEREEVFQTNLERLKITSLIPAIGREYMVMGAHVSMFIYNNTLRMLTDTMPLPYRDVHVTDNILFGREPILKVKLNRETLAFLGNKEADATLKKLNPSLLKVLRGGEFTLEPLTTLYVPRRAYGHSDHGLSVYSRIVPIYLLEKVMFRGTLTLANRRQASVTHVTAGNDDWEPSQEDLQALTQLLIDADRDPIGAVFATRNDVQVNEIKQAGDFWKWTDLSDELNARKLQALGINEAFMSGDASYNNMEQSISVFMEQLKAFRESITDSVFYEKLFPIVSAINSFYKDEGKTTQADVGYNMSDISKLLIPTVEWSRKLSPEGNRDSLDTMNQLAEKGVPFSVRMWAAAGGYDIGELITSMDESIEDEKRIKGIEDKRNKELGGDQGDLNPNIDTDDFGDYSEEENTVRLPGMIDKIGIAERDYGESLFDISYETSSGRRPYMSQDKHQIEANKRGARVLERMAQAERGRKTYYMSSKHNE